MSSKLCRSLGLQLSCVSIACMPMFYDTEMSVDKNGLPPYSHSYTPLSLQIIPQWFCFKKMFQDFLSSVDILGSLRCQPLNGET